MKYMGSKNRIAKHLLPIMLENRNGRTWVEPFVGGANMIDKVEGRRIGADSNKYLIDFWNELKNGWIPPTRITREEYYAIKDNKDNDSKMTLWAGICCSYSGVWFGSYAGVVTTRRGVRDYQREAFNNVMKQLNNIKDVEFTHSSYQDLEIPPNSLIYCDPPYEGTAKYKDDFNHNEFWEWCRIKNKEGHQVFISEYNAPEDFKCVWFKEVKSSLSANGKSGKSKKSIEKLFTL